MDIVEATTAYESWLSEHTPLIQRDLREKHEIMASGCFPFLRATFYRWAQLWPKLLPELSRAPVLLAVGDLHVENFGTWRDAEGRLIWGVNDFDEVCPMPYAIDLVRLAVSARLAIHDEHLTCDPDRACDAVLEGYREGILGGGRSFVLAEHDRWLRRLAQNKRRHPVAFWKKLESAPPLKRPMPPPVEKALTKKLPEPGVACRFVHRDAGIGSLGRQRGTLLASWRGSRVAREAKPLVPSAWFWARAKPASSKLWYDIILSRAVRVPDPFLGVRDRWVMRRLAPDCSRIELSDLPLERDELRLLHAMGWETSNIHLGSTKVIPQVRQDLKRRQKGWLRKAALRMEQATTADWKEWRRRWKGSK
jgi:hypothetical protein